MKTGVVKSVAALDKVLQICNAHGASYNPGNESLQPTALRSLLEQAQEKTKAVIVTRSAYALAVNVRKESFAGIPKLATQIARMVSASKCSPEDKAEALMVIQKFRNSRKKKKEMMTKAQAPTDQAESSTRSISQRDRDGIINTFHQLIQLVEDLPNYKPNEPEFKTETLRKTLAMLQCHRDTATYAAIQLSNARIARDQVLHGANGVIEVIKGAKDYIRAKFGTTSKQAKQTKASMNF